MTFPFPGLFAIDPLNPQNVAIDSEVTIFDPMDSSRQPLQLTDDQGMPIENPLTTNDKGFVGIFYSELDEVGWVANGLTGLVQSFLGIRNLATQAQLDAATSANEAASAAAAALEASQLIGAPADAAVSELFADNGSATQVAADARYTKRGELTVNVADFGATGDGTDETAKFQAAFDHVESLGGGEVFVPLPTFGQPYRVGKFYYGRKIVHRSAPGVRYLRSGLSWGGTNVPADGSSPLADINDPYSGHGDIQIIGGEWDGNVIEESYLPGGFNCFTFMACRNIRFDATVKDVVTNHALDINGVDGLHVSASAFKGYIDGTVDQSRNYTEAIQIGPMNDSVENLGEWVLNANGAASRRIVIDTKCYFGSSGTPGTQAWPTGIGNHSAINRSRGQLTGDITIRDNDFEGCTFIAITAYTWDSVTAETNRFKNCKTGIRANNFTQSKMWNESTKAWVTAPSRENTSILSIVRNEFENTTDSDILVFGTTVSGVDGAWGYISDVTITGNVRRRTLPGRSTGPFIRALICKRITVERNIGGWATVGIEVAGCRDSIVRTNRIEDTGTYGILVSNTGAAPAMPAENAVVDDNTVRDAGSHGIGVNAVQGFGATRNQVINAARLAGGAGLLLSGSDGGLVSTNSIRATSLPFALNGIQGSNSTNTNVTLDNRIEGVTTRLTGLTGAGTSYGNIQYT